MSAMKKSGKVSSDEYNPNIVRLKSELLNEVEKEYVKYMKEYIVLIEMTNPKNDGIFKEKNIRIKKIDNTYPYFGTIGPLKYERKKITDKVGFIIPLNNFILFNIYSWPKCT